jgi:hypothetical protein
MLHDVLRDAARFAAILRGFAAANNAPPASLRRTTLTPKAAELNVPKRMWEDD